MVDKKITDFNGLLKGAGNLPSPFFSFLPAAKVSMPQRASKQKTPSLPENGWGWCRVCKTLN